MKRLAIVLAACLVQCQPVPAVEPGEDEKGNPVIRLTAQEAALCNQGGGCALVTESALRAHMMRIYQAGYRAAVEAAIKEVPKCGRDV